MQSAATSAVVAESDLVFDGDWCLIDHDPITNKQVWALDEGGKMRIREVMPVDDILAENAALQVESLNRSYGDMALVARVPMHIWSNRLAQAIVQRDDAYLTRWLNDGDHARFRTRMGRI